MLIGNEGQIVRMVLEKNLARVREKLGTVETTLTTEIGHTQGLRAFSVKEIMYVYGVDRSTAYRWKKYDCHPAKSPWLDSLKKLRWTYQLDPDAPDKRREGKPWHPRLRAIVQARSSIRCAMNTLDKLDQDPRYSSYRFQLDEECAEAAMQMLDAAHQLEKRVSDAVYGECEADFDVDDDLDDEDELGEQKDAAEQSGEA